MDEIYHSNHPEKGNLQQYNNYRTISLINHASKMHRYKESVFISMVK